MMDGSNHPRPGLFTEGQSVKTQLHAMRNSDYASLGATYHKAVENIPFYKVYKAVLDPQLLPQSHFIMEAARERLLRKEANVSLPSGDPRNMYFAIGDQQVYAAQPAGHRSLNEATSQEARDIMKRFPTNLPDSAVLNSYLAWAAMGENLIEAALSTDVKTTNDQGNIVTSNPTLSYLEIDKEVFRTGNKHNEQWQLYRLINDFKTDDPVGVKRLSVLSSNQQGMQTFLVSRSAERLGTTPDWIPMSELVLQRTAQYVKLSSTRIDTEAIDRLVRILKPMDGLDQFFKYTPGFLTASVSDGRILPDGHALAATPSLKRRMQIISDLRVLSDVNYHKQLEKRSAEGAQSDHPIVVLYADDRVREETPREPAGPFNTYEDGDYGARRIPHDPLKLPGEVRRFPSAWRSLNHPVYRNPKVVSGYNQEDSLVIRPVMDPLLRQQAPSADLRLKLQPTENSSAFLGNNQNPPITPYTWQCIEGCEPSVPSINSERLQNYAQVKLNDGPERKLRMRCPNALASHHANIALPRPDMFIQNDRFKKTIAEYERLRQAISTTTNPHTCRLNGPWLTKELCAEVPYAELLHDTAYAIGVSYKEEYVNECLSSRAANKTRYATELELETIEQRAMAYAAPLPNELQSIFSMRGLEVGKTPSIDASLLVHRPSEKVTSAKSSSRSEQLPHTCRIRGPSICEVIS